ncbi:MAG: TPM domain-containing protein [Bacteroidetes bacterium]|nr:TPM domain-containing protein [Bacteroidota bacterium]
MSWKPFLPAEEQIILEAIRKAELTCSGEIRLHVDQYCKGDPLFKAKNVFYHLKMDETRERNGVLIYLSVQDKKFSILGDIGIHEKVQQEFWDSTRDKMQELFKGGKIAEGIAAGIHEAGIQLSKYFPWRDDDTNELPDDISYGS